MSLNVNIGTNSYEVASEWKEVSLKHYADILRTNKIPMTSAYIRGLEIISCLLIEGDSSAFFDDMFNNLYEYQVEQIAQYVKFTADDVKKKFTKKNAKEIEIVEENGTKWGVVDEFMGLKGAERVTLELELAEEKQLFDPLELTFGILVRRKNEDGSLANFSKVDFKYALANLLDKVSIIDIFGHISFFLNSGKGNTIKDTQTFSLNLTPKRTSKVSQKKSKKK